MMEEPLQIIPPPDYPLSLSLAESSQHSSSLSSSSSSSASASPAPLTGIALGSGSVSDADLPPVPPAATKSVCFEDSADTLSVSLSRSRSLSSQRQNSRRTHSHSHSHSHSRGGSGSAPMTVSARELSRRERHAQREMHALAQAHTHTDTHTHTEKDAHTQGEREGLPPLASSASSSSVSLSLSRKKSQSAMKRTPSSHSHTHAHSHKGSARERDREKERDATQDEVTLLRDEPEHGRCVYRGRSCVLSLSTHALCLYASHRADNDINSSMSVGSNNNSNNSNGGSKLGKSHSVNSNIINGIANGNNNTRKVLLAIPADSIAGFSYFPLPGTTDCFELLINAYIHEREMDVLNARLAAKHARRQIVYSPRSLSSLSLSHAISQCVCVCARSSERVALTFRFFYRGAMRQDCRHLWAAVQHLVRMHSHMHSLAHPQNARTQQQLTASRRYTGVIPQHQGRNFLIYCEASHKATQCSHTAGLMLKDASIESHLITLTDTRDIRAHVSTSSNYVHFEALLIIGSDAFVCDVVRALLARSDSLEILRKLPIVPITPRSSGLSCFSSSAGTDKAELMRAMHIAAHSHAHKNSHSHAHTHPMCNRDAHDPQSAIFGAIRGGCVSLDIAQIELHTGKEIARKTERESADNESTHTVTGPAEREKETLSLHSLMQQAVGAGLTYAHIRRRDTHALPTCVWLDNAHFDGELRVLLSQTHTQSNTPPHTPSPSTNNNETDTNTKDKKTNSATAVSDEKKKEIPAKASAATVKYHEQMRRMRARINKLLPSDVVHAKGKASPQPHAEEQQQQQEEEPTGQWVSIRGPFAFVWAVLSPHTPPGSPLGSGLFTIYLAHSVSRWQMSSIRGAIERGEQVFHEHVRVFQCAEYELSVRGNVPQTVVVDGDTHEFVKMRAKVVSGVVQALNTASFF